MTGATTLNSRERMIAVLEHRQADRVPLAELWIDQSVVDVMLPGAGAGAGATPNDLVEHLGTDVVTVATMIYEPHEVEWVDLDQRIFKDKWGALQRLTHDAIPISVMPPRIEDAGDLAKYTPPNPADSPVLEKVRKLKQRYPNGEKAIMVVGESGWAPAVYLRGGLENLLMDIATEPGFFKDLLSIGADYYSELYPLAIEAGADIILLGDDYADKNSTMMSPTHYTDLILPADAQVVAAIKNAGSTGGYCIKHTDGNINGIMDQLVSTGIDALGPLEPVADMELDRILDRYSGKIAVMGNVPIDMLSRGTPEQVIAETKRLLATVSAVGPHIMSSANTIAASVKPENYMAMIETTMQFGTYPIDTARLKQPREET